MWKRRLTSYPSTGPRMAYLGIVVLTTIMLYYLYYVEGAVTPLMLPYYHMSFQYFLYLLVVSNAIGAFSAFLGGLSDKIGRANLTIYGTLVVAVIQLFAIPHITEKFWFAASYCVIGFVEGVILVSTPALDARLLAADGSRRGDGLLGPRTHHGRTVRQPGSHPHARPSGALAGPVHHLGAGLHGGGRDRLLLPARALPAAARPADGVRRERALVEARAKGIDVEKATRHPIRSMMKRRTWSPRRSGSRCSCSSTTRRSACSRSTGW